MPTATATRKRKTASALEQVHEREAAWKAAQDEATTQGRAAADAVERSRALHDERRRLVHREPGLVDHLNQPLDKDGPIAALDKEIGELGDLAERQARYDHSRRLTDRAKQSWQDYVAGHLPEIVDELRPEAEAVTETTNGLIAAAHRGAAEYLGFVRRVEGYVGAAKRDTRSVPGLDAASELVRFLEGWQLVPPLPKVPSE